MNEMIGEVKSDKTSKAIPPPHKTRSRGEQGRGRVVK